MKHWLITGGSGYIGSQLLFELDQLGQDCVSLDIEESPLKHANMKNVKHVIGDARNPKILDECMKNAEGVVHLAGYKYAAKSVEEPGEAFEANFVSTARVLESMKRNQVGRIIFASSCSIYGSSGEINVNENSPIKLESPYSQSKYFSECLIDSYAKFSAGKHAFNHSSLRFFNVVGVGCSMVEDKSPHNLFPIIKGKIDTGGSVEIFGNTFNTPDGTAIRDYVYIEEVTEAIRIVMKRMSEGRKVSSVYNLGSGIETSVLQVLTAFNSTLSHPLKISMQSARTGDPSRVVSDNTRAKKELNWNSRLSLQQIIETVVSTTPANRSGLNNE